MGVIINTNYRVGVRGSTTVGWPLLPSAYDEIAKLAPELRAVGFSAVLFAPFTKGSAGQYSSGYDIFDNYDIGTKPQPYGITRTGFGTGEELRRCIGVVHAEGLQAYGDLVLHQYLGGDADGNYRPLGSDGKTNNGRFPKTDKCFVGAPPRVEVDPVPDSNGNFAFGDMAAYVHSEPPGYMHDETIKATQWLVATTGVDGFRIDDAKGTNAALVYDLLHAPGLQDKFAVAEFFDGNPAALSNYVWGYERGRVSVLDFAFKFNVGSICNNNSRMWMGQLANIGYCIQDSAHAITFVESADSSTSFGQQTVWNKQLAYAIMLTFPGYPCVFFQDWQIGPDCYGLKAAINNLVWIHETFANGDFVPRLDTDPQVFVHECMGYNGAPGCVCAFNNDQWNSYTRTVQTSFGPNQKVHEYTGNAGFLDLWTDWQGRLTFTVPRNNNGASYLVFAKPTGGALFNPNPIETAQTFFGALDLDIPPLPSVGTLTIGRVWVRADTRFVAILKPRETAWGNTITILLEVVDEAGDVIGRLDFDDQGHMAQEVSTTVRTSGWHALRATTAGLPLGGSEFSLEVIYTAALV